MSTIQLIELKESKWFIQVRSDSSDRVKNVDVSSFSCLGSDGKKLLLAVINSIQQHKPLSQVTYAYVFAREVGRAIKQLHIHSLPKAASAWQDFILQLYEFVLIRPDSKMTLLSRILDWNRFVAFLLIRLRDEANIIPQGVEIPHARRNILSSDSANDSHALLGENQPELVSGRADKLLVSISLARTDAQYLDEVRDLLALRRRIVHDCLWKWWDQIKRHYEFGRTLMERTSWAEIEGQLDSQKIWINDEKGVHRKKIHFASGTTEHTLANLLSILRYKHNQECSSASLNKHNYLPFYVSIKLPASCPPVIDGVPVIERLNWMLGNLSMLDIAVCCALLIMNNPNFTPLSIIGSKVNDKNGKTCLEISDLGKRFRIDKLRAKKVKDSSLDFQSVEIIETVLSMTSRVRDRFTSQRQLAANFFFILHHKGRHRIPEPHSITRKISGLGYRKRNKKQSFMDYFPELASHGLSDGTVTFSKLRATEGVLEWFRTGSVHAMTRKLGNSVKVVLDHYLPQALVTAWNARLIRRYQNLWITVAAANEDFLLEVTDFNSFEELHLFIYDMLIQHPASSSALGKELHLRLSHLINDDENRDDSSAKLESILSVPISSNSLAALYLYRESALKSGVGPELLKIKDRNTGISPRQIIDLVDLLRFRLPTEREPGLRRCHNEATLSLPKLASQVHWNHLFLSLGDDHCV